MKKIAISLLFCACVSCDDYGPKAKQPDNEVLLDLTILDEDDRESDIFPPGTDIRIVLKIINHTDHDVEWKEGYTCSVLNSEGFMDVYQSTPPVMWIGTPYQRPIDCEGVYIPPMNYPPGESVILAIPWSLNPSNEPLPEGEYFVSGRLELLIDGEIQRWELMKEFKIE